MRLLFAGASLAVSGCSECSYGPGRLTIIPGEAGLTVDGVDSAVAVRVALSSASADDAIVASSSEFQLMARDGVWVTDESEWILSIAGESGSACPFSAFVSLQLALPADAPEATVDAFPPVNVEMEAPDEEQFIMLWQGWQVWVGWDAWIA